MIVLFATLVVLNTACAVGNLIAGNNVVACLNSFAMGCCLSSLIVGLK